jgi:hypothetical protein
MYGYLPMQVKKHISNLQGVVLFSITRGDLFFIFFGVIALFWHTYGHRKWDITNW